MGSIHSYSVAAGRRYRISYRQPNGPQATLRGFRTKHEAEISLAEVEISKNRGEFVDPSDSRAPLGMLGTEWLAARQTDLKPSTFRSIDSAWRIHVRPKWERRAVGSIRHSEVQAWTSELAKTHSPTTVRRAHEVLAGILDVALRDRRIASNPARGVKLPRKVAKSRAYLTHQQGADLARASSHPELVVFLDVQAWINKLSGEGLAPATVHHCYVALRKLMKHALWDRQIAFNPCDGIDLPKAHDVDEGTLAALTYAQVEAAAGQLALFQPYNLLVRFMAYTGLRAGEVAGLRVRDVDLAAGHVSVRQTAQHIAGEWVFGTPKSRRSSRDVPLLDRRLIADLKAHKMQHPRSGDGDALFWPGRTPGSHRVDYGRVWDLASVRRIYFKPALSRAELPAIRVHDLRHTAASLWLAAGFPPYQVSRWLGHASVVTTDTIYSHLYPTDYAQHIAKFEAYAPR